MTTQMSDFIEVQNKRFQIVDPKHGWGSSLPYGGHLTSGEFTTAGNSQGLWGFRDDKLYLLKALWGHVPQPVHAEWITKIINFSAPLSAIGRHAEVYTFGVVNGNVNIHDLNFINKKIAMDVVLG